MEKNSVFSYAIRGQGRFVLEVKKNSNELFKAVAKIVLNNYAFLKQEDRSNYAFKIASIYQKDSYFIDAIFNKLKRTKLDDDYTFVYLLDVLLLFLLRNKLNVYKEKLINLFNTKTTKNIFSINESASASKILSVILEVYKDYDFIETYINNYYHTHKESNLDLFIIGYTYKVNILKERKTPNLIMKLGDVNNYFKLIDNLNNDEWCRLYLFVASVYINNDTFNLLLNDLLMKKWNHEMSKKILQILINSDFIGTNHFQKIFLTLDFYDDEYKVILLEKMSSIESKKIKQFAYSLLKTEKYAPYCIINIINNYNNNDYKLVHKHIRNISINYKDNNYWYEIESALIKHFKRKNTDKRLLKDIYYFMNYGLSSDSRYNLVKILIKNNYLSDFDYECLKYDANPKTNKLIQKNQM